MSDVPWAPGRRALVRVLPDGTWFEGTARTHEDGHVEGPVTDAHRANIWYNGDLDVFALDDDAETALIPNQCPRCFEVDTHANGCMVAANLARGVPAFWAPFAMWEPPPGDAGASVKVCVLEGVVPVEMRQVVNGDAYQWMRYRLIGEMLHEGDLYTYALPEPGSALVALGPDGPTLAPWGEG